MKVLALCLSSAASTYCIDAHMLDWKSRKAAQDVPQKRECKYRFISTSSKSGATAGKNGSQVQGWLLSKRTSNFLKREGQN